jgi:Protein of unknown function (DUF3891)
VIVRRFSNRLQLITQPDHAHLAGRFMQHCVTLVSRPRRDSILHAIAEHDNGWAEVDAAPTVHPDTGVVVDFINAPIPVRHGVWPRGVARLAADSWAAALVAQHAVTVYDRYREDTAWRPFFGEMEKARDALVRQSGVAHAELAADYVFIRLADLISLTFCLGWSEEQRVGEWTIRRSGTSVGVMPDPFGGATIPIEITAREIPDEPYRSDVELRDALSRAKTVTLWGSCTAL